jgi:hypothetical protein
LTSSLVKYVIFEFHIDFLNSVETMKSKKKEQKESGALSSTEKTVTKVYNFAGERVEVEEKVKGPAVNESETTPSTASVVSSLAAESSSASNTKPVKITFHKSNGTFTVDPGQTIGPNQPPPPKRIRISFLSGDAADIGLAGDKKMSAKEGITNVLNALNARNKKLGTLDKSKMDWEKYKKDQGIQDELENHRRSKHG